MDTAHAGSVPVIVIQHTNPVPGAQAFRKGTERWELHKEIKQRHADILIEKTLPGSFTGTILEKWLKERNISNVTIAGYMIQMCCDTTARQAFHRGFAVNSCLMLQGTLSVTNSAGSISDRDLHRAFLITQQMRVLTGSDNQ